MRTKERVTAHYHKPGLKAALLRNAETILEREGVQGLTLRATARAAGVSHAAPKHHFGDHAGLLADLAALGFDRLAEAMLSANQSHLPLRLRLTAVGAAYVDFAKCHPGLFSLMFQRRWGDSAGANLRAATQRAREALQGAVLTGLPEPQLLRQSAHRVCHFWSVIHGFTLLLLDNQLEWLAIDSDYGEGTVELLNTVLAIATANELAVER